MKRILVCEDEDVIRDFVVINLKRAGYDVIDVNCGESALQKFDDENGNFDIVLLDIMMPGIDGFTKDCGIKAPPSASSCSPQEHRKWIRSAV